MTAALAALAVVALLVPAVAAAGDGAVPRNLKVGPPDSSAGRCLKLTWEVDDPSGVTAYRVYRSSRPDEPFEMVWEEPVNMSSGNLMDHTDYGLEPGSTYYYKVALKGRDGRETGTTDVVGASLPALSNQPGGYAPKHIILSQYDQRAYFLENEVLIKSHLISTGVDSHPTPYGVFYVESHEYVTVSEKYGNVYLYWWMGFYPDTGMHAIPYDPETGEWYGGGSLGEKASHGCVRQAVADAQWAYQWAPNGTRIDIIGSHYTPPNPTPTPAPPPPPPTVKGGHASQGISQAAKEWYFAEGCTSGKFDEYITVMNPNPTATNLRADYMKPDGSTISAAYSVPGFARYTIHVNEVKGLESADVSAHLTADQAVAAERAMYFNYVDRKDGSCSAGISSPSNTWYLAEGYTGGDFDEFILIQNPNNESANVTVLYMPSDGPNVTKTYGALPHSRLSIHVDDIEELKDKEVSAKVMTDRPTIVERSEYFDYYDREGGNASTGIKSPAKTWYLAEGYTGGQFDEYVLIQNPNDAAVHAKVTFMLNGWKNVVKEYDIVPRSRFSIHVDDVEGLENQEVSTYIEATAEVIAERTMYFISSDRPGGSDAPGISEPAKYWYLAEGYTGGEFDTYVCIMNPNAEKANVDVNYLLPGGGVTRATYTINPQSRATVHVDAINGMSDTEFSTALTGDRPIICERAMYFSTLEKQ